MRQRAVSAVPFVVVALAGLAAAWDVLAPYQVFGHSAYIDYSRVVGIDLAVHQGFVYPRWLPDFYFGYGSPIFNYYAPLPYLLAELFNLAGAGTLYGIKLVYMLGAVCAGVSMCLLARELFGPWAGLGAGVMMVLTPYFLVDLYVRSSIGEVVAMAVAPLLFYFLLRLHRTGKLFPALSGAVVLWLLIFSHNISALIFVAAAVGFALVLCFCAPPEGFRFKLIVLFGFGLIISSYFWAPALLEKGFVQAEESLTGKYFNYELHFATLRQLLSDYWGYGMSVQGEGDTMPLQAGRLHLLMWCAGLILLLLGARHGSPLHDQNGERRDPALYLAALAPLALFFTLETSGLLWRHLPLIRFVQFPWRFLMLFVFSASLLAGLVFEKAATLRSRPVAAVVVVALLASAALFYGRFADARYLLHDQRRGRPVKLAAQEIDDARRNPDLVRLEDYLAPDRIPYMGITSTARDDYLPVWVKAAPAHHPKQLLEIKKESVAVVNRHETPRTRSYLLRAGTEGGRIVIHTFYFPGWIAMMDGERIELAPEPGTGLIVVDVPPGIHELVVTFADTPVRKASTLASLGGAVILVLVWTVARIRDDVAEIRRKKRAIKRRTKKR